MAPYISAEIKTYAEIGASRRLLMGDSINETSEQINSSTSQESLHISVPEMRKMNAYPILTPIEAQTYVHTLNEKDELMLHPLISGLPMDIAQEQLECFAKYILPMFNIDNPVPSNAPY